MLNFNMLFSNALVEFLPFVVEMCPIFLYLSSLWLT